MSLQIHADYPGANIIVDDITADTVRLHQDLGETSRDWFYWGFTVSGAAGRNITFEFTESRAIGVNGPAWSDDQGQSWQWLGVDAVDGNTFTFSFEADVAAVQFCMAIPYQWSHWQQFYQQLPVATLNEHKLCTTRHQRDNKYYELTAAKETRHRLALTARHHCCEMMVNFVIEGFLQSLIDADTEQARYVRDYVSILLVPFVDLDGAEEGDQGKGREPRDHGRDYVGESVWPDTGAIRRIIPDWGIPELLIDLHCPWIAGHYNEFIYQVGSDYEVFAREQAVLNDILAAACTGSLPFHAEDYLPYGEAWNTEANRTPGSGGIHMWSRELTGIRLGTTFEFPYSQIHSQQVTTDNARRFGVDLLAGVSMYLQQATD